MRILFGIKVWVLAVVLVAFCGPGQSGVLAAGVEGSPKQLLAQGAAKEERVAFNTNSRKFHNPRCEWAIKCTRNCISLPRSEALRRGGVPCKVCGGR